MAYLKAKKNVVTVPAIVDRWRISSGASSSVGATILTSNFEHSHTYGAFDPTIHGMTGMTESSGVFTFPEIGVWLIIINAMFECPSGSAYDRRLSIDCWSTTDSGSNYYMICQSPTSMTNDGFPNVSQSGAGSCTTFDVYNTSTHKVQFRHHSENANTSFVGNNDTDVTAFAFIRLGDT